MFAASLNKLNINPIYEASVYKRDFLLIAWLTGIVSSLHLNQKHLDVAMTSNEAPKALQQHTTARLQLDMVLSAQLHTNTFLPFHAILCFCLILCQTSYIFLPFCSLTQTHTVSLSLAAAKSTALASYASPLSPAVPSRILYSACTYHLFSVVLLLPAPLGPSPC